MSHVSLAKVAFIVMMMLLVTCSNMGTNISALSVIIVLRELGYLLNAWQVLIQMKL